MNRLRYSECKEAEVATRGVLLKKVFLETSQNSQENTYNKDAPLLKKRLWHRCFCSFIRDITPFLENTSGQLFLKRSKNLKQKMTYGCFMHFGCSA